jgi:ATP synthase protein I
LWGLGCIALPSTVFAARLALGSSSSTGVALLFFAGEFLKVAASVALMALVARFDTALVWWAFVLAAVLTLKSYFIAFFLRKPCQQLNIQSPPPSI